MNDRTDRDTGLYAKAGRDDRTSASENRAISDDDRVAMYRSQFHQDVLPDLPEIDGYHVCWLTTTNPRDSIHTRMRLGYEPITPADIPGFQYSSIKTGEWAGFIGVNEMLAFKIPLSLYQRYMYESHTRAPLEMQQKIASTIDGLADSAQQVGGAIHEGDGFSELRKPIPTFKG